MGQILRLDQKLDQIQQKKDQEGRREAAGKEGSDGQERVKIGEKAD